MLGHLPSSRLCYEESPRDVDVEHAAERGRREFGRGSVSRQPRTCNEPLQRIPQAWEEPGECITDGMFVGHIEGVVG